MAANPTISGCVSYWATRLNGEEYTNSSQKAQALQSAIDVINRYKVENATDTDIEFATYEQAKWLLGSDAEMQANGISSFNVGGISESYNAKLGRPADLAPNAYKILTEGADGSRSAGLGVRTVWL